MSKKLVAVSLFIISLLFFANAFAQNTAAKIKVDSIAPGFWVYQSYGDYNGQKVAANGLIYQAATGIIIVDTPWDTVQTKQLLSWIDSTIHKPILFSIHTHYHADRVGGLDIFHQRGIRSYASAATIAKVSPNQQKELIALQSTDTTVYATTTPINIYYPGPGHTTDNVVAYFPLQRVLFGGCLIKSTDDSTLGNTADADLKAWPDTMKKLMARYNNAVIVIPGHGSWQNKNSIQHTIDLLNQNKTQ